MSRLIDADKFLDFIKSELKQDRTDEKHLENIICVLENLPTAFDVEKVVSELEDLKEENFKRGIKENEPALLYASSCLHKALEIVKVGEV